MKTKILTCKTCKYWNGPFEINHPYPIDIKTGECKRHAPIIEDTDNHRIDHPNRRFPLTHMDMPSCGDYEVKL